MAEKCYYSIGEVAEKLGLSISLLRYWEKEFPFISPKKSEKGTRIYTPEDINNIRLVHHLVKEKKLTLDGAKKKLKENKDGVIKNHQIILHLQEIKKEIHDIRKQLDVILEEE